MLIGKPAAKSGLFFFSLLAPIALVAAVVGLFVAALPGSLQFDDRANLSGLAGIVDFDSAWRWIRAGTAGPTGRPLALATFALQAYQWPDPAPFLAWNIALQAINALLVLWLAWLVCKSLKYSERKQIAIAFFTALAWAVSPLLNSATLFIVQRMTLLSGTFVLLGLIVWLKLRPQRNAPWWRQVLPLAALAVGGGLATLAKESGVLIIVYALVLEFLLRTTHTQQRGQPLSRLPLSLLLCVNVALLLVLLRYADWGMCTDMRRGFTVWQRLGAESALLLVYLKGLFIPVAADLNPFRFQQLLQDIHVPAWSAAAWFVLMAIPLALAWWARRRARVWFLVALTLAWFLYGHIMESGWIALEPYFAHRNYLPALGLIFALVCAVFSLHRAAYLWRATLVAYIAVLGTVTWMDTSLWGNPLLAGEIWAKEEPGNIRAALNLSYSIERTQGAATAQAYLDNVMLHEHDSTGLRLQSLVSACRLAPSIDHSAQVRAAVHAIKTLPYEGWATDIVEQLLNSIHAHPCKGVGSAQVAEIASAFLSTPVYVCGGSATKHNMLAALGFSALDGGDRKAALDFFRQSLQTGVSYGLAGLYLDLAKQQHDLHAIHELKTIVSGSRRPADTSPAEWHQLLTRIDDSLGPSTGGK